MHIVPVMVGANVIGDGEIVPVLGQDVSWPLLFGEVSEDEDPDPQLCRWWPFLAAANGEDTGQRSRPFLGPPQGPALWPTLLHGPGWVAGWFPPRRVRGPVRLRGQLWASDEHLAGPATGITGRITRIRVVTEAVTLVPGPYGPIAELVAGTRNYHDVQASPLAFDRGSGSIPSAPHQPLPAAINPAAGQLPPEALVHQPGVLTDLELT